nr:alpha amylase C-terminal domain-containing protein [Bacillus licheniformis]
MRYGKQPGEALIIVCNFTPSVYHEYRVGVPFQTEYIEVLNSDDAKYGGSHQINPKRLQAKEGVLHGKPYSISMTVPPLGVMRFSEQSKREERKRDERTMCGYAFGWRQGKQAECLNEKPRKTGRSIWRQVQNH